MNSLYKQFMLESNKIEGEDRINPGDIEALKFVLNNEITTENILKTHELLGNYLNKDWVGKYRTCEVSVGGYSCPPKVVVKERMDKLIEVAPYVDSWNLHNSFEFIHPFRDLNGRTGRLLWLKKAIKEGYNFNISFLHEYYYQTLIYATRKI